MIATPTHVPLSLIKSPSMKRASCFAGGAFLTLFLTVACRQAPNSTDQTSTLDAGLIAHWSFESTSNPGEDVSGNEHHGRAEGTVSIVPGRVGDALDVSGGNHFIRVTADPDVFRFGPDDAWSMAGWLKKIDLGDGWQGVVTKSRDQDHWLGMWISSEGYWHTGGGAGIDIGTVSPNEWYHWVLVQEPQEDGPAEIRLYVNGKLHQTAEGYRQRCGPGDLLLGKARTPNGDESYDGLIDEVRIYDRGLTAAEILELAMATSML